MSPHKKIDSLSDILTKEYWSSFFFKDGKFKNGKVWNHFPETGFALLAMDTPRTIFEFFTLPDMTVQQSLEANILFGAIFLGVVGPVVVDAAQIKPKDEPIKLLGYEFDAKYRETQRNIIGGVATGLIRGVSYLSPLYDATFWDAVFAAGVAGLAGYGVTHVVQHFEENTRARDRIVGGSLVALTTAYLIASYVKSDEKKIIDVDPRSHIENTLYLESQSESHHLEKPLEWSKAVAVYQSRNE